MRERLIKAIEETEECMTRLKQRERSAVSLHYLYTNRLILFVNNYLKYVIKISYFISNLQISV